MPAAATPVGSRQRAFLDRQRVARLATADAAGVPHVLPICFALVGETLYSTVDEKPKRPGGRLKRLTNIAANPRVAVVADQYAEDWSRLAWVMLHGKAEILTAGEEHAEAQAALRARYPQYREMNLELLPVIAVRIERAASWGALGDGD